MAKIREMVEKITGKDGRGEADVDPDDARADARDTGGDENRTPQEGTTTGTAEGGEFVGRVAGDDDFSGETGAERRAQ